MTIASIKAVTLDLDDTLWPVGPVIQRAEKEVSQWLAVNYPVVHETFDAAAIASMRRNVVVAHRDRSHDLTFLRRRVYADIADACGLESAFADEAFAVFDHWRNQVELFPGVELALAALAAEVPIVAVTNGNASVERIGLGAYFQSSVHAGDAGAAKPDRRIFELALERLALPEHAVLHIGDDPGADIAGAQDVGLRTAWINRDRQSWPADQPSPDIEARDLAELAAALSQRGWLS